MTNVKTYHKLLNKIKSGLEHHYNVQIKIEFNGSSSLFVIKDEGKFICREIPQFLIDINTHDDVNYLELYDHFKTIGDAMFDILTFRYSLNGKFFNPLPHTSFFI